MEDQRLRLEQAHGFLVVEAVQDGLVVQRQQLFGGQRVGQGGQVLPTGLAGLGVLQAVGGKLLQQQARARRPLALSQKRVGSCSELAK